jgi:kynurenine formamidase
LTPTPRQSPWTDLHPHVRTGKFRRRYAEPQLASFRVTRTNGSLLACIARNRAWLAESGDQSAPVWLLLAWRSVMRDRTSPSPEQYLGWAEQFCNWGRWGADDERGTLNFITNDVRRRASALVQEGHSIGLGRPIDTRPSPTNPFPAHHFVACQGSGGMLDYIGMFVHGFSQTHIDALCHLPTATGRFWNDHAVGAHGMPADHSGTVDYWRSGVTTRGVLYDIPRLRDTEFVEPGKPVMAWELLDAAEAQGVQPMSGDAVVIRCGRGRFEALHAQGGSYFGLPAGVHASVVEFLYEHEASLVLWDWLDAPPADQGLPRIGAGGEAVQLHVHDLALPYMGLPLVDNADLEELSSYCSATTRWTFQLVVAPLVIVRGTGSPVNPLAIF